MDQLNSGKQKGGGVGQQAVGQTQHPSRNCGISAKGGRGKKYFYFCDFFFAEPIFAKGTKPKINIFLRIFFCDKTTRWTGN